ncbi:MAG TPA: DUF6390 family protein, partial [Chloroflexota bacterium]|nr:DUF6390 family protein [Chloroflexota bacterium]
MLDTTRLDAGVTAPLPAGKPDGRLFSLGFSLMPNRLGYCGGPDQGELRDYYVAGHADTGLDRLLHKFEGAMPYLRLIAGASGVADPLHADVVEAYWIGNSLLDRAQPAELYRSLEERFKGRVSPRALELLLGKVPAGARPHHNFHVFDTYLRTGTLPAGLETLEQCRIGWGTVVALTPQQLTVLTPPLVWEGHHLALGPPQPRTLRRQVDGHIALPDLQVGDEVALHWGWPAAQ